MEKESERTRLITITVHHCRTLLLVPVLAGVALLLGLTSDPAEAATAFTVNDRGDAKDRKIDGVCDALPFRGQQCTLRAAIQEANATPNSGGPDEINFAIGGPASVKTINVGDSRLGALPTITEAVTIDGYTQGSTTATTSDDAKPNDNTLPQGTDAVIKIELNGTNAGASANGLRITASNSTIKGLAINRFAQSGILVEGSGATGNKIEGNFIGTGASGTQALGNSLDGVRISGASGNTVGGTQPAQTNVVSGNGGDGVEVGGAGATGNTVQRNYVGTDASGNDDLGNSLDGVRINGASDNTIGGVAYNVVSGNDSDGVAVSGSGATGNTVQRNRIGIGAFFSHEDIGNAGVGVSLTGGAHDNLVGGLPTATTFPGNTIAFSGEDGILVDPGSTGNRLLSNETYLNGGLGIDLSGGTEDTFGVTANDIDPDGATDDADAGANNLQNFPVIVSAIQRDPEVVVTTIDVRFHSTPNQTFTIQFFKVFEADTSFHGEGELFAGQTTTTTDADGNGSFTFLSGAVGDGDTITATATNTATGDTSEFSENVLVTVP